MGRSGDSIFNSLGGRSEVEGAGRRADHPVVRRDRDAGQIKKQETFLTTAFGGPDKCTGGAMRAAHGNAVLAGLNDTHFDAVVESLGGAFSVPRTGCVCPWS